MARPPEIKRRISSGGVIFRRHGSDVDVAIVLVRGGRAWCIPKGIIDKGEDAPAAALREVREETGLAGEIIGEIGRTSYWYRIKEEARVHKTVHFFLMKYMEGNTGDHDHEVDEARWLPIAEALNMLTYKSERDIMGKAQDMIKNQI